MTAGTFLLSLAVSLCLTVVIEFLFALLTGKHGDDLWLVIIVNIITNPVVVTATLLARHCTALEPWLIQGPLEAAAIVAEGMVYRSRGRSFARPFLFSFAANILSLCIGMIISMI